LSPSPAIWRRQDPHFSWPQLLSLTPPHNGGLLPLSFGLFHQQEVVRDLTVDLFTQLRMFPVSFCFVRLSLYRSVTSWGMHDRSGCSSYKRSIIFSGMHTSGRHTRGSREAPPRETPVI
jgi:hypothetical protein